MMAALGFIVLASACLAAHAFPEEAVPYRNTIFGDEKIEGEVFENIDAFKDIALFNTADNPYRLPTTTRPKHYNILWDIDIANLSFSGVVDIDLYATRANVNEIVIHAYDLNIDSLNLIHLENGTTVYQTYTLQPEHHFLRVRLTSGFLEYNPAMGQEEVYRLTIGFHAPLRTDMYGIYQSWYRNNHTEEVSWMASTQFQGTSARFAFPCYDEPSFKAVFDISIRRPVAYSSWSCTTLNTTDKVNASDYETDIYHPTPVMSTYLLAIIVAEYTSQPENGPNPDTGEDVLKYEVIGRPSAMESGQGNYSFDVGKILLAEMSEHTAMDFYSVHPYIKMTQAAIPDFSAGAMENWGLLTYREAYLMYSEEHTNSYFKQMIAYILSHEIAHMWFGNLVTCDWWDVLWLNEGFARYYQYFLTDWVEGYMGLSTRFITEQVHTSLLSDSADNPQPLTNPGVGSPSSVSAMFSTISYNKGASVIRMTEHLMGFNNHRQGLRRYLETRAFTSALPIDLFQDLQAVALDTGAISEYGPGFNIVDYYKTWTEQGGHPVLNVYVNHQTGIMTIYQRQFNINSGYAIANRNWIIPITFSTASNPDFSDTKPTHIISDAISTVNRSSIGDEWVIFNKQQTGFYRVNYDDYTWNLIVMHLRGPNRESVHEYNRAQIVNDVFQFARSGVMNYSRAFDILSFLRNEIEYTPWVAAITGFNWINNRLINTELEIPVNNLFLNWAGTVIRNLTYDEPEGESFMRSYLRYQLAPVLCRLGDPECIEAAKSKFESLRVNDTEVPVDSRNWVYCNALRNGTIADFNFLWTRFLEHPVYTEKIQLLMVLGCTPHEESLNEFLDAIVTDNYVVRRQDYTTAFSSAVTGNEGNTQIVFRYIQNNLKKVIDAFNSATTPLSYISSRLRTIEEVNEFRKWAADNQATLGTSYQAVVNAAETSISAMEWSQEVQDDIRDYLLSGDTPLEFSTPSPVVTTTPATATAALVEAPTTPDLPDSANTSFLSALAIMLAIVSNFIF